MSFQLAQKADSRNAATQVSRTRFSLLIKNNGINLEKIGLMLTVGIYRKWICWPEYLHVVSQSTFRFGFPGWFLLYVHTEMSSIQSQQILAVWTVSALHQMSRISLWCGMWNCVSWLRIEFRPWVSEGVKRAQIGFVCRENLKGREKHNLKLGYIFVLKKVNIPPP